MHVTLIEPPKYVSRTNHVSTVATPPLGLAYLASSLEAADHHVFAVDAVGSALSNYTPFGPVHLRGLTHEAVVDAIPADTDVIGVGCMFSCQWPATRELLHLIRRRFPNAPLVIGGEHPTGLPELSMAQAPVDFIVFGEGEKTLVELLSCVQSAGDLSAVPGIAFREARGITVNPRRGRIRHVDDIPVPAWHLFPVEAYMAHNQPHGASRGRFMPMLATRGCPYECAFCTSPSMWTQRWIARDPKRVVDEMESYVARHEACDFQFEDLTAIVRKDWVKAFCEEILRRGLRISWQLPSSTRSEAIDEGTCRLMKAAGCHEFAYAPESGSPRTLKLIKKKVSPDRLYASARAAMKGGINVGCFFILGFPHETWRDVLHTYRAAATCAVLGFSTVNLNAFSPQPNTELYRGLLAEGKIQLNDDYFWNLFMFQDLFGLKKSYNERFGDRLLSALIMGGYVIFFSLSFLIRPWRLISSVRDMFRERSGTKLGRYLRSVLWWSRPGSARARP